MDAQDVVLDSYPHAEAMEEPPIFRHGDFAPIDRGYWIIVADGDGTKLGDGATEEEAWEDAVRRVGGRIGRIHRAGLGRVLRLIR